MVPVPFYVPIHVPVPVPFSVSVGITILHIVVTVSISCLFTKLVIAILQPNFASQSPLLIPEVSVTCFAENKLRIMEVLCRN